MKKEKKAKRNWFSYVVIAGVLLIPFMYSFFYLKAYWDPYGNMKDIPVAVVNEDAGVDGQSKGKELVDKIKEKNTLDINVVNKNKASEGLKSKKYYAVITIPADFSSDLLSASSVDKTSATITYSPNQKTNYLSSQIISRVMLEVEKEVRSNVTEEVVSTLTNNLNDVPNSVDKISGGLSKISNGTNLLSDGASSLKNGTNTLNSKYKEFNDGVYEINNGSKDLYAGINKMDLGITNLQEGVNRFAEETTKLNDLKNGVNYLQSGQNQLSSGVNTYINSVNMLLNMAKDNDKILTTPILSLKYASCTIASPIYDVTKCGYFTKLVDDYKITNQEYTFINLISDSGSQLSLANKKLSDGINELSNGANQLSSVTTAVSDIKTGVDELKNGSSNLLAGSKKLSDGANVLYQNSNIVQSGINDLDVGVTTLKNGTDTLNSGTKLAKDEVATQLASTKTELDKLRGLNKYTANSVNINEIDENKVNDYGTAFAPFFMSIALWVGSLMLFIILYYDVNERFKKCGRNASDKLKRTFCYLGLATAQGIILGILLLIGLDFNITNYFLYFGSLILVACAFEAIIEFLIVNFGDVGKFVALILLVLQLAAAGGTFPIQTVSKGFQKLFNFLPMKYTIDLFKESLISVESSLLGKSLLVVFIMFLVFFIANIIKDLKIKKEISA